MVAVITNVKTEYDHGNNKRGVRVRVEGDVSLPGFARDRKGQLYHIHSELAKDLWYPYTHNGATFELFIDEVLNFPRTWLDYTLPTSPWAEMLQAECLKLLGPGPTKVLFTTRRAADVTLWPRRNDGIVVYEVKYQGQLVWVGYDREAALREWERQVQLKSNGRTFL